MGLSCYSGDGDYEWYYNPPEGAAGSGYAPLSTKRGRKCCSCRARIAVGDTAVMFERWKYAEWGTVEANIYGDGGEVTMAPWYMCESCGDLYYSLSELGFCITLGDDMRALVDEYAEMRRPATSVAAAS